MLVASSSFAERLSHRRPALRTSARTGQRCSKIADQSHTAPPHASAQVVPNLPPTPKWQQLRFLDHVSYPGSRRAGVPCVRACSCRPRRQPDRRRGEGKGGGRNELALSCRCPSRNEARRFSSHASSALAGGLVAWWATQRWCEDPKCSIVVLDSRFSAFPEASAAFSHAQEPICLTASYAFTECQRAATRRRTLRPCSS